MNTQYWKLRITGVDEALIKAFVSKYAISYIWSFEKEGTDRQHAHLYFETNTKGPTIRSWIRKNHGTGNGKYSMENTEALPIEYCAYILKDRHYFHNMPEEYLQKCLEHDDAVKVSMKSKKSPRRTILTQMQETLLEQIEIHEHDRGNLYVFTSDEHCVTRDRLITFVIDFYKSNQKRVNPHQLATECHSLSLWYVASYEHTLQSKIEQLMDT